MFISTVNIQCGFVSLELYSQLVIWTFRQSSSPNEGHELHCSAACCVFFLFFVFREVSRSDLHTLRWPALKNFLSPWQRRVWGRDAPTFEKAGCCCLPTAARAPASPHNPRSDSYQPRDFHLFLYVHLSANKPFFYFFVVEKARADGCWENRRRRGGSLMYNLSVLVGGRRTWGVIWVRGGKVGGQNGEVRDVGGGWRRGNPNTRTFSPLSVTVPSTVSLPVGIWVCRSEQTDLEKNWGCFYVLCHFFLNQSMFPFRTRLFAWAATAHSLRQILYSYKIKLLQGRWCRIAFAHLALGGRSLETEEEKRSVKTGIEGWRKPSRLLHPWRVEQICFVRRPPLRPHSLTPPSHRYSLTTPTFLHDPLTHSRFIPFFFFFPPRDVYTFLPSTCLAAGYGVRWNGKGRERQLISTTIPSGRGWGGRGLPSYTRPVNNLRGDGRKMYK